MPGAHRDLSMWKPLQAEEMLKAFDMRKNYSQEKIENYKWMVPNEFKQEGHYYNSLNKHFHLNPRHTKPGKYGYNRDKALSMPGMSNLKGQYDIAGAQMQPDFHRQIDDLENYITHNKRAPIMERSYKSQSMVHHVAGGPFYPGGQSFVVHKHPSVIEDRIVMNEYDIEWFIRQALRWDDLFVSSYNQIEDVKERITKFLATFNGGYQDFDVYRGHGSRSNMSYFPWEDYEIWQVLENCRVSEEEMLLHLSRIPDDLLMYQVRWMKYQELMRIRIEIERWLYFLANEFKRPYNPPVILEEPKKPGSRYAGEMVVFWDYILEIFKKVKDVQIVYGIYNHGSTVLKPRLVDNKPVENTMKTRFTGQAIFDITHLIKDVKAHNESFLIFEVQGNPESEKFNIHSLGLDQGNGYPLREEGDKEGWDLFTSFKEDDQGGMKTLGWSFLDLFDLKKELKTGCWKVPLYLPPTVVDLDIKRFQSTAVRIPKTMVHLRLDYPDLPDIQNIDGCHLQYQHLYRVPDYHNFICKYAVGTPGRDPDYKCPGVKVYVHSGIGWFPERKVRIAWCAQLGKHVLSESEGVLCFYATQGKNPNTKEAIRSGAEPSEVIVFNDGKDWYKDFYDLYWKLREKKLESDLYLIIQYLQLKEGVMPSVSNVISRVLLEEEYDLLGYGVIKLNDTDGKMKYGDYRLDLHEGPIYVEDVEKHPKNGRYVWVSFAQAGTFIKPRTPPKTRPPQEVVDKFNEKFGSKRKKGKTPQGATPQQQQPNAPLSQMGSTLQQQPSSSQQQQQQPAQQQQQYLQPSNTQQPVQQQKQSPQGGMPMQGSQQSGSGNPFLKPASNQMRQSPQLQMSQSTPMLPNIRQQGQPTPGSNQLKGMKSPASRDVNNMSLPSLSNQNSRVTRGSTNTLPQLTTAAQTQDKKSPFIVKPNNMSSPQGKPGSRVRSSGRDGPSSRGETPRSRQTPKSRRGGSKMVKFKD